MLRWCFGHNRLQNVRVVCRKEELVCFVQRNALRKVCCVKGERVRLRFVQEQHGVLICFEHSHVENDTTQGFRNRWIAEMEELVVDVLCQKQLIALGVDRKAKALFAK